MKQAFALIHTWPDLRNAEYEVLHRIVAAAERVDKAIAVINNDGVVLWASPKMKLLAGAQLPPSSVDFLLSLHFESPKVVDVYSYYALWQPINFYYDFNYQRSVDRFTSHNDVLSCASDVADAHAVNAYQGLGRQPLDPLPQLFHNLPEPYLEPNIDADSRLFYIGINWERIGRPRGRFHDALVLLDKEGLTDIYGPEKIHGVAPWEGFDTYRGELPFDGKSVKAAINRAGICLALSSAQHKATGVMSNRLFEGLAGGAAVIANAHPLIDKFFSDVVYQVDDTQGDEALGRQIIDTLLQIRADPEAARQRTERGQQILRERFSLEDSITKLFSNHATRVSHFEQEFLADAKLTVILEFDRGTRVDLQRQIKALQAQTKVKIDLELICDDALLNDYDDDVDLVGGSIVSAQVTSATFNPQPISIDGAMPVRTKTGKIVGTILSRCRNPYVAFLSPGEYPFADHFASLARAIEGTSGSKMACSGLIREVGAASDAKRTFEGLRFMDLESIVTVNGPRQKGRFLYRTDLFVDRHTTLMSLLDGEEHRYFRLAGYLAGPLAQTNYASYLQNEGVAEPARSSDEPIEAQQQFIRDQFVRDPRWLDKLNLGRKIPEFIYAYGPGAPVRWADQRVPQGITRRVEPGVFYPTRAGGSGLAFLSAGFAEPESEHIWLGGHQGIIEFSLPHVQGVQGEDYELVLNGAGRRSIETGREQHCTVAINGQVVTYVQFPDAFSEIRIKIPPVLTSGTRMFRVELTPDHADAVYSDAGAIIDHRRLSVMLKSIGITQSSVQSVPRVRLNRSYPVVSGSFGTRALVKGFHSAEKDCAWISGSQGTMAFKVESVPAKPRLRLSMKGRRSLASGKSQQVTLTLNGTALGAYELAEDGTTLTLDIDPALIQSGELSLQINTAHAEAVFNAQHQIVDNRLLGAALCSFQLVDPSAKVVGDRAIGFARRIMGR